MATYSLKPLLIFVLGYILGAANPLFCSKSTFLRQPTKGFVTSLSNVPFRPTSHVDANGQSIVKQQLIEPFLIDRLAGISVAKLRADQVIDTHAHTSMHEFFLVLDGQGQVQIDSLPSKPLSQGSFVYVAPREQHRFQAESALQMMVIGVTDD